MKRRHREQLLRPLLLLLFALFSLGLQAQTVKLPAKKLTVQKVISAIKKQTKMSVDYRQDALNLQERLSFTSTSQSVDQLMKAIIGKKSLEYTIRDSHIIVSPKKQPSQNEPQGKQEGKVKGHVADASGLPIIGATIKSKDGKVLGVSDLDGNFTVLSPEGSELEISYIGYTPQTVKASASVSVTMKEDAESLSEVVVVGYGTVKRVNLGGAVATADDKVFASRTERDAATALQGEVPGLTIIRNSGFSENNATIRVRDVSSINDGSPLVLIDGAEGDLSLINPADIDNISVLKDGTAAIYGARAANGVVLVTTKTGKMNQKVRVDFNGSASLKTPGLMKRSASLYEHAAMMLEITDGSFPIEYTEEELELIKQGSDKVIPSGNWGRWSGYPKFYKDQDWNDLVVGNGSQQNYNVSISGGGDRFNFMVSLGYQNEQGILKYGKDDLNKYFVRAKANVELLKNLKYDFNLSYEAGDHDYSSGINEGQSIWELIYKERTWTPLRNPAGHFYTFEGFDNPAQVLEEGGMANHTTGNITFNNQLRWTPLKGLDITGQVVLRKYDGDKNVENKMIYSWNWEDVNHRTARKPNYLKRSYEKTTYRNYTLYANYQNTFGGKHAINVMAGCSHESESYDYFLAQRQDFDQQEVMSLNLGSSENQLATGNAHQWTINSFFSRLNYTFNDRYILEGTIRADASSRFASGHRTGWFPGVNAAWRIGEETFMKKLNVFDDLKVRASYGEMGNQTGIGYYDYIPLITIKSDYYPFGNGVKGQQATFGSIVSLDRTWETIKTTNVGLDFAVLNNRLYGSFDYFWKHNDNMLIPITYPALLGADAPSTNSGKLRVHGWELILGWRDRIKDFNYSVRFNISDSKNKVVSRIGSNLISLGLNSTAAGYPVNSYFGYVFDGIIQNEEQLAAYKQRFVNGGLPGEISVGDAMYKDLDGDGQLSVLGDGKEGSGDVRYMGDTSPRYNFGLNLAASWKGFDLSIFIQGVGKRTMYLQGEAATAAPAPWYQSAEYWYGKTWTAERTDAKYPALTLKDKRYYNYQTSDNTRFSAAYARLKNLQVGYTFSSEKLNKWGIQKLRVYFSGENLCEIHDVPGGWDPEEQGEYWNYPFTRDYSIGVSLSF